MNLRIEHDCPEDDEYNCCDFLPGQTFFYDYGGQLRDYRIAKCRISRPVKRDLYKQSGEGRRISSQQRVLSKTLPTVENLLQI